MNRFRKSLVVLMAVVQLIILAYRGDAAAPGPKVSENKNKHNLSIGSITSTSPLVFTVGRDSSIHYKATDDPVNNPAGRQICIFCHTPHNASSESPAPLWNRKLSTQTFSRYSSATLQIRSIGAAQYGSSAQPDGASKLCLSCHDGVSNLGAVLRGAPATGIAMDAVYGGVITGIASFNPSTNKMKTGHHPVSFVYNGAVQYAISSARTTGGFKLPTAVSQVKLDKNNKMQCTTCHDPHQNQSDDNKCYDSGGSVVDCDTTNKRKVAPFWVLPGNNATSDHDDVCKSCHNMSISPTKPSWP